MTMRRLTTLLLVCWSAATTAHAQPSRDLFALLIPPELVLAHAEELGLSAAQRHAVEGIRAELGPRTAPLLQQMRAERDALVELLGKEKPDEAAVLARFERLSAIETDLKRLRLLMSTRTKRVLTADQQARAAALQETGLAGSGPPPGAQPLREKLERVKAALEQWKREGRDVTRLRELWDRFREAEAKGHYRQARQALDEAIALLEAPPPRP
jgi:Spy/CpxP family protein refolding chaperone